MTNKSELEAILQQAYQNLHASLVKQHAATLVSLRDEFLAARAAKAGSAHPVLSGWEAWPTSGRMGRFEYRMNENKRRTFSALLVRDPAQGDGYHAHQNYVVAEDFDARVQALAQKFATEALEGYIAKLTGKLTNIWGSKQVSEMQFQGSLDYHFIHFKFTDGSRFTVQNSVVHHVNQHGTWYAQFPTTFHGAVLSNGMAMKQLSEAKMKKLFKEAL